jgi:hypothetical protein
VIAAALSLVGEGFFVHIWIPVRRNRSKTLVPPVEIPTGTFAWFADPEGNTIGLWKPK